MSDYLEILPTGNAEQDTTNIQQAVDALAFPLNDTATGYYRQGTVRLSGIYRIIRPIVEHDATHRPVAFDGQGMSTLMAVKGFPVGKSLLSISGGGRCRTPLVRDLELRCGYLCRGVKIAGLSYRTLVDGLRIDAALEVGLHVQGCYACRIDNVEASVRGVSLWLDGFNSSVEHVKVGGYSCWNVDSKLNSEQRRYECANGYAAAKAEYPGYREAWPAELPGEQRAAIVATGGGTTLRDIDLETNAYCSHPLLYLANDYGAIRGLRCENNMNSDCKIRYTGHGLTISEAHIGDSEELGPGGCHTFLECVGDGGGVLIDNALMMGFRDSLVSIPPTWAGDTQLSRITTRKNVLHPSAWVQMQASSPTPITPPPPPPPAG